MMIQLVLTVMMRTMVTVMIKKLMIMMKVELRDIHSTCQPCSFIAPSPCSRRRHQCCISLCLQELQLNALRTLGPNNDQRYFEVIFLV